MLDVLWCIAVLWTLPNQKHKHTLHAKGNSHHIQECLRRGRLLKRFILSSRTLWLRLDFIERQTFKGFSTISSWILLIERKYYVTTVDLSGVCVHNVFLLPSCHVESGLVNPLLLCHSLMMMKKKNITFYTINNQATLLSI